MGGKKVGIISHVEGLKERIKTQIQVREDRLFKKRKVVNTVGGRIKKTNVFRLLIVQAPALLCILQSHKRKDNEKVHERSPVYS